MLSTVDVLEASSICHGANETSQVHHFAPGLLHHVFRLAGQATSHYQLVASYALLMLSNQLVVCAVSTQSPSSVSCSDYRLMNAGWCCFVFLCSTTMNQNPATEEAVAAGSDLVLK